MRWLVNELGVSESGGGWLIDTYSEVGEISTPDAWTDKDVKTALRKEKFKLPPRSIIEKGSVGGFVALLVMDGRDLYPCYELLPFTENEP